MDAKLVIVSPENQTGEYKLKLPTTIGRGRDASLKLLHALVSRLHCEIFDSDDGYLKVRDLGSLNGTYIAGERVTEARLKPGALLTVGTVTFKAIYDGPPSAVEDDEPIETEAAGAAAAPAQDLFTETAPESAEETFATPEAEADDEAMFDDDFAPPAKADVPGFSWISKGDAPQPSAQADEDDPEPAEVEEEEDDFFASLGVASEPKEDEGDEFSLNLDSGEDTDVVSPDEDHELQPRAELDDEPGDPPLPAGAADPMQPLEDEPVAAEAAAEDEAEPWDFMAQPDKPSAKRPAQAAADDDPVEDDLDNFFKGLK